ncbi:hypothetical protein FHW69_002247 [Luteibacter sp. Sphag1AF]|uniref:hypothetical protein n=1 Tax=Luteibacter sp. Sphag1AF TaxID=2587031 RepID=UPI001616E91C|nr:hypothetical protein [Luteibacter sp. Sphag1AF]MBB3227624.1 hypothetical protein [Luteibacter sp. Sphag1AF]
MDTTGVDVTEEAVRSSLANAVAEMLQLLFRARQERASGVLLDRCPRPMLEALLSSSDYVLQGRVRYVVEDRLRFRKVRPEPTLSVPRAMQFVLNLWCQQGRRTWIRNVLSELTEQDIDELARMPELDSEVVSIMRESSYPDPT